MSDGVKIFHFMNKLFFFSSLVLERMGIGITFFYLVQG